MDWIFFMASAGVVIAAGIGLALCADVLAERTGLGALWFGAVVVALVTSLPELVTDISAVRRGAPALALGDLFGSSMANMAILASVTLVFPARRLLQRAALEHVLTAALAIALTSLALVFISAHENWPIGRFAIGPTVIAVTYVIGTYLVRERQVAAGVIEQRELPFRPTPLLAVSGFFVLAAAILAAGPLLARSADRLAEQTGLGETFFGAFALALVTSLPELSVSIAAIRIGAFNLAIANLLGSNATNMALLLPLELAYEPGSILAAAGPDLQVAATTAILLMAIGTSALVLKAERGRIPLDFAAVLMLVGYLGGLWAIYDLRL
jgi:cation:H+ antiporter